MGPCQEAGWKGGGDGACPITADWAVGKQRTARPAGSPQPRERGIEVLVHGITGNDEQAMPAHMQHFASLPGRADTATHGVLLKPRDSASEGI